MLLERVRCFAMLFHDEILPINFFEVTIVIYAIRFLTKSETSRPAVNATIAISAIIFAISVCLSLGWNDCREPRLQPSP